ncbi:transposase [Shewanella sp. NIFS-20-20]|uniref:REP-associated tyrosine transposase n=1 Tax=Shewanella sp. NIFS-20-20 TaxID=2853806 RepID=UPI002108E0DE|nr:transposase [Shewanella sp. NIFS-20-20]
MRLEFAGALYHVTSRGNARKPIYLQEDDFELFLNVLSDVCERYNWVVHAYCLMTNHYHLLVETPDANLSKGMRQLNGVFTQSINRKHHKVGHLFQGRYKAILVDKDTYLLELCRYIVLNPVRAKMVNSPDEWLWSSWHCMLGKTETPPWLATDALLRLFSNNRHDAIESYIEFVNCGVGKTIWDDLQHQIFLGDEAFVVRHQAMQDDLEGDLLEIPLKQRTATPLTLDEYLSQAVGQHEAIVNAYASGGYTQKQIGDHFGLHYSQISRIIAKFKT